MRVLVLSQFYPPDITAAAFRVGDSTRLLADRGHDVKVLTAHPHKARAQDETKANETTHCDVRRCPIFPAKPNGAVQYIAHYLSFTIGSVLRGLALPLGGWRPDVIWASSPPLFVGLAARILSIVFRRPYVLEIRDIWPDSAVAAGQLPGSGRAYDIGKWMELHLYRHAARIVCVAQPMRQRIAEQTDTKVSVAYNGVLAQAARQAIDAPAADPGANGKRDILYAGNLGHLQELDLLVRAFAQLRRQERFQEWRLRLLGAGAQSENLARLIEELELGEAARIDPAVSHEAAAQELRNAHLLYLNLKKHPVLEKTIPSKVFDCLLAGRPIVAGITGEGREILDSTGANVTFEPGCSDALLAALERATSQYEELSKHAGANQRLVLERFTREQAIETLLEAFESAVGDKEK